MKPTLCSHEQSIIAAVQTESWTDALRMHLGSCASCQETFQIAGYMHSLAAVEDDSRPLPDAKVIWLKAQLAQRRASAAEALRPVETFQRVAWGVSILVLFFGLLAKWTLLEKAIAWLNTGWGSLVSQAGLAGLLSVVGILTLGLVGAASLLGLDHGFHGNESGNSEAGRTGGPMKRRFRGRNLPMLLVLLLSVGCGRFDDDLMGEYQHRSSDGFRRLQVASTGQIEFTEDERDVLSISPGGHFVIQEKRGLTTRRLEIEAGPDGKLTRSYTYRGEPRAFDSQARAWFESLLQGLIRDGEYGAPARAQRILQRHGPMALLDEISRIKRNHVKRLYFEEVAKSVSLDFAVKQRIIRQASEEISSDREKAELFEKLATHFWNDPTVHESLIQSVNTIHSNGERARLVSHFLEKPDTSTKDLDSILSVIEQVSSDGEKSRLLQQAALRYGSGGPVRVAFFRALNTMHSNGERRETLSAFLRNSKLSREDLVEVLESVARLSSDGEKASLLVEMTKHYQEDVSLRAAFFKATDSVQSSGENRRVLSALLEKKPSVETLLCILQSTKRISSDGEKAALLMEMAKDCVNNSELLATFLEVGNSLGSDGEYRRVLSIIFEDTDFLKRVALQKGN
jgi:hypothetical protein